MDKDLIHVLERIANAIEESNDTLSAIASHYDSIVPTMKKNQEAILNENGSPIPKAFQSIFGTQEN
jgi:hypothetical protein